MRYGTFVVKNTMTLDGFQLNQLSDVFSIAVSTIQGVSRLEDITAGGDFLGLCD